MQVRKIAALCKPFGIDAATVTGQKMTRNTVDETIACHAFFNILFAQCFFRHIHKHCQPFNFGRGNVYDKRLAAVAASCTIYCCIYILKNTVRHLIQHSTIMMTERTQKVVVFFFFFRSYSCNGLQIDFVCGI